MARLAVDRLLADHERELSDTLEAIAAEAGLDPSYVWALDLQGRRWVPTQRAPLGPDGSPPAAPVPP